MRDDSTGSTKLRQSPLAFVYTGGYYYRDGSLSGEGSRGRYWSRAAVSGSLAFSLDFNSISVYHQNNDTRGLGLALRCVGR